MAGHPYHQFDVSYARTTEMGRATYLHHIQTNENKEAASILYQFSTDHGPHPEHSQIKLPPLKINSQELMSNMTENLRRDGFTTHDPAPGHSVNAAGHIDSLRLPPLQPHVNLPPISSLHHALPSPCSLHSSPVKADFQPTPSFQPPQPVQNGFKPHAQQTDVVADGDETEEEPETSTVSDKLTRCKFNGETCGENNDNENPRKVVSHIFGRNKICTVFIPDECWVWWCRKHYQRCRYHTDNWALKQIEILYENLDKIEGWGGVESFTLALRKRETDRNVDLSTDKVPASRRRAAGRASSSATRTRTISNNNTTTTTTTAAAAIGTVAPGGGVAPVRLSASGRPIRSPVNIASPVPRFLQEHVGQKKSFSQVREILHEIKLYVRHEFFENNKEVSFPDVEILPNYTQAILREKGVPGGQLSDNNHSRRRRARKPVSSTRGRAHPYASNANF
ncbi:uncharacterized protein TRUGW13939_10082 [Talaromyces rugulosus]|uniref:Uncharacterized protein n=1 Tax=Talaromyces rugulosus TaxID=121627 RepID=A0A7H8R907_TALRU|nr:uncharacterized protein TRUGW13939_10082 [Talaromyces rugulosus]QKX62914.1 hypothetical protein TRUGW13939_10082 [Talaromyces rugulosus]